MNSSIAAAVSSGITPPPVLDTVSIDSRFGAITIRPEQAITFPTGLLGMPGQAQYCLARFPSEKMARFSILQSVTDHSLAFITLPLDIDNPIIEREDMAAAARDLSVPLEDLIALLIVSVRRDEGATKLTANARAPILLRPSLRVAAQYVFPHAKYDIRQPLAL